MALSSWLPKGQQRKALMSIAQRLVTTSCIGFSIGGLGMTAYVYYDLRQNHTKEQEALDLMVEAYTDRIGNEQKTN